MRNDDRGRNLLLRIDAILSELSEIKQEISEWMNESEPTTSGVIASETSTTAQAETAPSGMKIAASEPSEPISTVMSEIRKSELNIMDDEPITFIPKARQTFEDSLEPRLYFHPRRAFSLADTFLYANELCFGNKGEFESVLDDIEKMSSWSQLENYIYVVLKMDRESENVLRFMDEIKSTATTSKL